MNVEIGAEAALFPEKEYIKGIFVAVYAAYVSKNMPKRATLFSVTFPTVFIVYKLSHAWITIY